MSPVQQKDRIAKRMQPFHLQSRIIIAAMLVALLTAAGGFWWSCTRSDGIAFLPARPGAEWIVYPKPLNGQVQYAVPLGAVFRHTFTLDTPPARATLTVRAFKSAAVVINGQTPGQLTLAGGKWKLPATADVTGLLRAGTNEISVCVTNSLGPPALWLRLQTDRLLLGSDECWEVSLTGAAWENARRATRPPAIQPGNLLYGGEPTLGSVKRVWLVMVTLCAVSLVLVIGISRWLQQQRGPADGPSAKWIYGLFVIVVIARTALFINNLSQLPRSMGFDVAAHEQYIQFIQEKHALPLPKNGWEMYQPPLYYLCSTMVLDACGLSVPDTDGACVLRIVNGIVALVQCWLALLCLRLLFPKSPGAQAAGLLIVAFLPPHLYLSQYVTNEPLAGLFATVALYFCLRALQSEKESIFLHLGIGAALGAAMLTKFSALLAIPVFLAALGLRLLARRNHSPRDWLESVRVVVLSLLLVCGWYYAWVWAHFGRPIVGNWDSDAGAAWWQEPGFRTGSYYFNFGRVLVSPLFSGFHSFADGIYSTLWGDGLVSGAPNLVFRPPWNYDWMNAGYLLALGLSVLFLVGFAVALYKFIRQSTPEWFLILGMSFLFGLGVFYMSLRVPAISVVKAFFAFPVLVPFSALVALGGDWLQRKHHLLRTALWVLLLAWTTTVYTAFWVRRENPETPLVRGISLGANQQYAAAVESLTLALQLEESAGRTQTERQRALINGEIQYDLGLALEPEGRAGEAMQHYRDALKARPDFPEALNKLAWLLATSEHAGIRNSAEAVTFAEQACKLTSYRKTIMVGTLATADTALATAYAEAGQFDKAIVHYQKTLELQPNNVDAHKYLAWILAACPDASVRNGTQAVGLAEQAEQLSGGKDPAIITILAAAYAEVRRFPEAVTTAQQALQLAAIQTNTAVADALRIQIGCYEKGAPFRDSSLTNTFSSESQP